MYKLYLDKQETFEANIQIDGASSSNSLCRLVVEHNNFSILFEGKIQNNVVKIPIGSLKNILQEGSTGKLKLEIIADDTFFQPWEQTYEVVLSKKVTAEVFQGTPTEKKKPIVEVTSIKTSNSSNNELINFELDLNKILKENNITLYNVNSKIKTVQRLIKEIQTNKYKSIDFSKIPIANLILETLKTSSK